MVGVPRLISKTCGVVPEQTVQAAVHFLDLILKCFSVHLAFGHVETLREKKIRFKCNFLSSDLPLTVGRTDCNQCDELQGSFFFLVSVKKSKGNLQASVFCTGAEKYFIASL